MCLHPGGTMITPRENRLRALEFCDPEWIPCSLNTAEMYWWTYGDALQELSAHYPKAYLEKELVKPSIDLDQVPTGHKPGSTYRDDWGILWKVGLGTTGSISVEHPLSDWSALDSYHAPDPMGPPEEGGTDWAKEEERIRRDVERGLLASGYGGDIFTFLIALRGYEALMLDFATSDPHLERALDMLVETYLERIHKYLALGVDVVNFHSDLGTQRSLAISPDAFRRYIVPRFQRMMLPCREAGAHVFLSSDGYMLDIVDDLVACGVSCHDPQISANGLAGIKAAYQGKMCAKIRLDPQSLPFVSTGEIREMVRAAVEELATPEGGVWLDTNLCTADVPMENLAAICQAYEEFCF